MRRNLRNKVELLQIQRIPGYRGIRLETRFLFFAGSINRSVNFFELTARGVLDYLWPRFVCLAQGNGIAVSRTAVFAQCLVRFFGHVRSAHNHGNTTARMASAIRYALATILVIAPIPTNPTFSSCTYSEIRFIHRVRVAVDQYDFVSGRRNSLQKEHP